MGALPAVTNAVVDALAAAGVRDHFGMPATPDGCGGRCTRRACSLPPARGSRPSPAEREHIVWPPHLLYPLDGTEGMASVVPAIPFAYVAALRSWRRDRLWAVHEPRSRYRARGTADPAGDVTPPRVRLHLKPGQKGTKQLLEQYGDRLVCVRYRYDPSRGKRLKTVELIVAERDWQPRRPPRLAPGRPVSLRIAFAEVELRRRVKQAGGTWDADRRAWQLPYNRAVALGLGRRVIDAPASTDRCPTLPSGHLDADA